MCSQYSRISPWTKQNNIFQCPWTIRYINHIISYHNVPIVFYFSFNEGVLLVCNRAFDKAAPKNPNYSYYLPNIIRVCYFVFSLLVCFILFFPPSPRLINNYKQISYIYPMSSRVWFSHIILIIIISIMSFRTIR